MTEQQKRVIRENPHLQAGRLAEFLGLNVNTVRSYRVRNKARRSWTYTGLGIPMMFFNIDSGCFIVSNKKAKLFKGVFSKAIDVVDRLLWCIENNMFNQPRIEHPYFENLGFSNGKEAK